ncbi:hypothetical protein [Nonomuraea basaltis]|nr:hypothetical protein [Nonomuraea basaltis]
MPKKRTADLQTAVAAALEKQRRRAGHPAPQEDAEQADEAPKDAA